MEFADNEELFAHPAHPYTRALLSAIPILSGRTGRERIVLSGDVPSASHIPSGCRFRTRCPWASAECAEHEPELKDLGGGHLAACLKIWVWVPAAGGRQIMYLKTSGFGELHEKRYQHIQIYGIMSAERTLYLRIPVCAFTAQIRAHQMYCGRRPWDNDHRRWSLYLRIPVCAFTAQIRAQ